ncbi:MAG: efflux RND transporter periplasmic adaptor subunit [Chloroflexaceae bacterium]|jgi:RND family efflux transporter MFP subunit|nr:efflux RND transporter periplasmic adaptor subunit [Chloroflexaceae bacterium]
MTAVPQTKSKRRFRRPSWPIIIAAILVIAVVATLVSQMLSSRPADVLQGGSVASVSRGNLVLGISATGKVEPRIESELAFAANAGRVNEVLVVEGDSVAKGAELVRLDTRQLAAEVAAAEASLQIAQADVQALQEGATPEQIAASQAQVAAAAGNLTQTLGSVTPADITAAQAAVESARATLAQLEAGPKNDAVTRAQTALEQARANLDQQRAALSAAKEAAFGAIEQRANAVRQAQDAYSSAYWDMEHVKANGTDPRTGRALADAQTQDFVNALNTATLNLRNAEAALEQAKVDVQTAQQNEISGIQNAEARVASAQADLDELLSGSDADQLASARAQLARAQADLARLTGSQRAGAVAAGQANVAQAQARLNELQADPKASDLARAEARVAQAQAQLEQAKIRLEDATLRAPFAGTVAAVNVTPGAAIGQRSPVTLIDTERFKVQVTVDEVDVSRVAVGQTVDVLIDALGAPALAGKVVRIDPVSQADSAVTSYLVVIEIDPAERTLKPGMTASATIVADNRDNTLIVPAQAVRTENGQSVVSIVSTGSNGEQQVTTQVVETGLRSGDQIEILSGLNEGQQVLIPAAQ